MADDIPLGVGRMKGASVFMLGIMTLAAGAISGVIVGSLYSPDEAGYDKEFVELTLEVLADDEGPGGAASPEVRRFALELLGKATGVEVSEAALQDWVDGGERLLPASFCSAASG